QRISVVVDVESIDRVRVEPGDFEKGIRVHDQHGPLAVTRCGENEQVGEVEAGIAPRKLEGMLVVAGAEMVGHRENLLMLQARSARDIALLPTFRPPRKPISASFTSSACVASRPWGAPSITTIWLPLTAACVCFVVARIRSTRSASPCITSVGTLN